MKKHLFYILIMLMGACSLSLTSCTSDDEEIIEETTIEKHRKNIIGLWQETGTEEFWRFRANGQGSKAAPSEGKYWDEADDIFEEEANPFQWYIESTGLMVIHQIGGSFNNPDPEAPFKIESLTAAKMVWRGSDGTYHYFDKVNR